MTKRIYSVLLVVILTVLCLVNGYDSQNSSKKKDAAEGKIEEELNDIFHKQETLDIWYTDEALSDYLSRAALKYADETGVKVNPTLVSGIQYLEQINAAEVSGNDAPDLYIVTNDMIEKAYLTGIATPIVDGKNIVSSQSFSKAAISAVTYNNQLFGYPLYFETSVFLYNETYLHDMAIKTLENEKNAAEGEAAQQAVDGAASDEEIEAMLPTEGETAVSETTFSEDEILAKEAQLIPVSMDKILSFAESYDAPENVEAVFKWDVSDIFYNYFIVGDSIHVGGENGDDFNQMDINNQTTIDCLTMYQNLNQFFSIDSKSVTYDEVLQDFIDGKIVFTVATTDAIGRLRKAKETGEFQYDYAVTAIPQVSETLTSRSMSVTDMIAINGYSEKEQLANEFAGYLIQNQAEDFYTITNKIPARMDISYQTDSAAMYAALEEYAVSIPVPKMMRTANFWAQLEIAFTKIWDGADVATTLSELDQTVQAQIAGQ